MKHFCVLLSFLSFFSLHASYTTGMVADKDEIVIMASAAIHSFLTSPLPAKDVSSLLPKYLALTFSSLEKKECLFLLQQKLNDNKQLRKKTVESLHSLFQEQEPKVEDLSRMSSDQLVYLTQVASYEHLLKCNLGTVSLGDIAQLTNRDLSSFAVPFRKNLEGRLKNLSHNIHTQQPLSNHRRLSLSSFIPIVEDSL